MNQFTTHGAISWPELQTTDPAKATAFYKKIMGWKTETMPMPPPTGPYTVCNVEGAAVCGIMKQPMEGVPSFWVYYVTVDDADAVLSKATELGGTVIAPAMHVPTVGTLGGIKDPQGAVIMVMQYEQNDAMPGAEPNFTDGFKKHGAFSWFELRTPDTKGAVEFYSGLFGWNIKLDSSGMGPYYTVKVGDVGIGGIVTPPQETPPHWGAYVTVDDVDETVKTIKSEGGTLPWEPMDLPNIGRMAMFQDPTGAWLAAITYVAVEA